jgi:hypothetical protein
VGPVQMYEGVERRRTSRNQSPRAGVIFLEPDSLVECTVRDFSFAGAGLLLPVAIVLPPEFELAFNRSSNHCVTVWRKPDRMGLMFKTTHSPAAG